MWPFAPPSPLRLRPLPFPLYQLLLVLFSVHSALFHPHGPTGSAHHSFAVYAATAATSTSTPTSNRLSTPTPTLPPIVIPPQCQECFHPNSTSLDPPNNIYNDQICFKNTQCIPLTYFCDSLSNPCTDASSPSLSPDPFPSPDNSILCQDSLCFGDSFLPLPAPGSGKMSRSTSSDCFNGSYFSLYGDIPKYTESCVEPAINSVISTRDCLPWEYFAQGSCFLSTCGPGLDCGPSYFCSKHAPADTYGICRDVNDNENGNDSDGNSSAGRDGTDYDSPPSASSDSGWSGQYSSSEYLVQGLLIGICCLSLGIGLGVGFWHYKRKKFQRRWQDDRPLDEDDDGYDDSDDEYDYDTEESDEDSQHTLDRPLDQNNQERRESSATTETTHTHTPLPPISGDKQPLSSSTLRYSSWLTRFLPCGQKRRLRGQHHGDDHRMPNAHSFPLSDMARAGSDRHFHHRGARTRSGTRRRRRRRRSRSARGEGPTSISDITASASTVVADLESNASRGNDLDEEADSRLARTPYRQQNPPLAPPPPLHLATSSPQQQWRWRRGSGPGSGSGSGLVHRFGQEHGYTGHPPQMIHPEFDPPPLYQPQQPGSALPAYGERGILRAPSPQPASLPSLSLQALPVSTLGLLEQEPRQHEES